MKDMRYADIIDTEYHGVSRQHMPMDKRAAQFSAFAALKGFDEEIAETARFTECAVFLTEERRTELGEEIFRLAGEGREVVLTRFVPDEKKAGGAYAEKRGRIKRADRAAGELLFTDGERVPFDDILDLFPAE